MPSDIDIASENGDYGFRLLRFIESLTRIECLHAWCPVRHVQVERALTKSLREDKLSELLLLFVVLQFVMQIDQQQATRFAFAGAGAGDRIVTGGTMAFVKMSRKELYDKVWAEPMSRLAKAYGMSDVGLAKLCRRHDIPRPPRGYWAKKEFGKKPPITRLPNSSQNDEIELRDPSASEIKSAELRAEVKRMVSNEERLEAPIIVSDTLRGAHALVSQANEQFQGCRASENGLLILPKGSILAVQVSKANLRRSLLIMDALLKGLLERGYQVAAGPKATILESDVKFSILERLTAEKHEHGEHDLEGRYEFGYSRFSKKWVPSGKLTLQIDDSERYWARGCRKGWRDGEKTKLESILNKVVAGLVTFAGKMKEHREEEARAEVARREKEQRREELALQRAELRKQFQAERERVATLLDQSKDWRRSQVLREYIDAAKNDHLSRCGSIEEGSEFAKWLEWAVQQADRLDPLKDSPPSILDTDPKDLEEPKQSWWG